MKDRQTEQKRREEELDQFWDIESLLPVKKKIPVSRNTETVSVTLNPLTGAKDGEKTDRTAVFPSEKQTDQQFPDFSLAFQSKDRGKEPKFKTVIHSERAVEEKEIHHYVYPHKEEIRNRVHPDLEYVPESALIHNVRIFKLKSNYQYYGDFYETAKKLQGVKGTEVPHVPFFSYVPQYLQMNRAQTQWYLWMRTCIEQNRCPDTDYSYLLLYVYELINLSDDMEPELWLHRMMTVYRQYANRFRQLMGYIPEWICDYCLIHQQALPDGTDHSIKLQMMKNCSLKEFFVGGDPEDGYLQTLMDFCSNYDYHKSKFCTKEHLSLFDSTMHQVLQTVTERLSSEGKLFSNSNMDDSKLMRSAYSGALCAYRIKRKIEVSYCSFSRSHELRFLITDILKYTENKIRAHIGVRSRLSVYSLPINVRNWIDECTVTLLPAVKKAKSQREREETQAYEALYDLPQKPFSLEDARRIESDSWNTTKRLVEAFEEPDEPEKTGLRKTSGQPDPPGTSDYTKTPGHPDGTFTAQPPAFKETLHRAAGKVPEKEPEKEKSDAKQEDSLLAKLRPYRTFLIGALNENPALQREAAEAMGRMPDAVADEINEISADWMGDILLEDLGEGYGVIEDYREQLNGLTDEERK